MTDEAKALVAPDKIELARIIHRAGIVLTAAEVEALAYLMQLIETQASENERLKAKVDGLRDLLVRGYVVCDGDDEDAVAFRNDAHAALAGDTQ